MDDLDTIREHEEHNFRVSREALGATYDLYDGVLGLYKLLADLVRDSKVPPRDDIASGVAFLLGARYALEKGVLELMRVHMTESLAYVRNAIEQAGFADLVRRDSQLAMTWLKSGDSPRAYKEYREAFSTGEAFPKDDPLMRKLYDRYDFASKRVHINRIEVEFPLALVMIDCLFQNPREHLNDTEVCIHDPEEHPCQVCFIIEIEICIFHLEGSCLRVPDDLQPSGV